jgi:hypothetical protein
MKIFLDQPASPPKNAPPFLLHNHAFPANTQHGYALAPIYPDLSDRRIPKKYKSFIRLAI